MISFHRRSHQRSIHLSVSFSSRLFVLLVLLDSHSLICNYNLCGKFVYYLYCITYFTIYSTLLCATKHLLWINISLLYYSNFHLSAKVVRSRINLRVQIRLLPVGCWRVDSSLFRLGLRTGIGGTYFTTVVTMRVLSGVTP